MEKLDPTLKERENRVPSKGSQDTHQITCSGIPDFPSDFVFMLTQAVLAVPRTSIPPMLHALLTTALMLVHGGPFGETVRVQ